MVTKGRKKKMDRRAKRTHDQSPERPVITEEEKATQKRKAHAEHQRQYRERHPGKASEYRSSHSSQISESQRGYRASHSSEISVQQREYHAAHSEQISKKKRQYRKARAPEISAKKREYRKKHASEIKDYQRQYVIDRATSIAEYHRAYATDHASQIADYHQQYVADHASQIADYHKQYVARRGTGLLAYHRKYVLDHAAEIAAYHRDYRRQARASRQESARRAAAKYLEKRPDVRAAIQARYHAKKVLISVANEKKKKGGGKKKKGKKKKTKGPPSPQEELRKRCEQQRRVIDLLPAKEYRYCPNNRKIATAGRAIAEQQMVRNLEAAYRKAGISKSNMYSRQVVQICLNVRNEVADSLRGKARILNESFGAIAEGYLENPELSLEEVAGEGVHRLSREPYYHLFAYHPHPNELPDDEKQQIARYKTVRRKMRTGKLAVSVTAKVLQRYKWQAQVKRGYATRKYLKYRSVNLELSRLARHICRLSRFQMGRIEVGRAKSQVTWPCDPNHCRYPTNPVARMAEMYELFANIYKIRSVIIDGRIDACSTRGGNHYSFLKNAKYWTEQGKELADMTVVKDLDRKGHPYFCLPDNCSSNLLFLRQMQVHFVLIAKLVRHLYRLMELHRRLEKIDHALIFSDYAYLEMIVQAQQQGRASEIMRMVGPTMEKMVRPEDVLDSLPYTKAYQEAIFEHPEHMCVDCLLTKYRKQVKLVYIIPPAPRPPPLRPLPNTAPQIRVGVQKRAGPDWSPLWQRLYDRLKHLRVDTTEEGFFLCDTCYDSIRGGQRFSKYSVFNDMGVDPIPEVMKKMNECEKVSCQITKGYQIVFRVGSVSGGIPYSDRQKCVRGQVFYYPLPLEDTVRQLEVAQQERVAEAPVLQVIFHAKPTRDRRVYSHLVNLGTVEEALKWLKQNNPLYANIETAKWVQSLERQWAEMNLEQEAEETEEEVTQRMEAVRLDLANRGRMIPPMIEKATEEDQERVLDACTLCPMETRRPEHRDLAVYQMKHIEAEKLDNRATHLDLTSFPVLFPRGRFGVNHKRAQPVTPLEFVKNRLMLKDPRFRHDHQYIFSALWNYELRQVAQGINQTLRNRKRYDHMTVGQFLDQADAADPALEYNIKMIFQSLRGSPEYWNSVKMDLLTMIRWLGPPTWFLTLSANEYVWEDMAAMLKKMNRDLPGVENMRTSQLCAMDPVSTQTQFHHRFTSFFNLVLLHNKNGEYGPLGNVVDYFWRLEYQSRGMPHYHILLWIEGAPQKGRESDDEIAAFIQKYATCRLPDPDDEPVLNNLVRSFQLHKDNSYCLRKVKGPRGFKSVCRFGFPRPTRSILRIRTAESSIAQRSKGGFNKRFYELPRTSEETRINDYNPIIMLLWRSNLDLQFVGDNTSALARYICGYVTKGEKPGANNELFREIDSNQAIWRQLYSYAFFKLGHRECGIIEAIDKLRSQPLYQKTRQTLYLNARRPENRTVQLRSHRDMQFECDQNPDAEMTYAVSYLEDYYPNRPLVMEDVCFYDFRREYEKCDKPAKQMKFLDREGGMKQRNEPLLISHTVYKKPEDQASYRYSLLLMFKPFRNETAELGETDDQIREIFEQEMTTNQRLADYDEYMRKEFSAIEDREEGMRQAMEQPLTPDSGIMTPPDRPPEIDVAVDELKQAMIGDPPPGESTLEEDVQGMNSDQSRVYEMVTAWMDMAGELGPMRMFLSGSGGTGKSFLINAIKKFMMLKYGNGRKRVALVLMAPTGLAAFSIGGLTVHRVLKLPVQHGPRMPFFPLTDHEEKQLSAVLEHTHLMVIDEISMVSNMMLLYVNLRLQQIFRNKQLLGGRSCLLVGDLTQLSPVCADHIFETIPQEVIAAKGMGFASINLWSELNAYEELRINMRQKEDEAYAAILESLRFGHLTRDQAAILSNRLIQFSSADRAKMIAELVSCFLELRAQDPLLMCLLPRTKMVMQLNDAILRSGTEEIVEINALTRISGVKTERELAKRKKQLERMTGNITNTAGVEMRLLLAKNCRVMLRRNTDVTMGLVNGALGTVLEFVRGEDASIVAIRIQFDRIAGHQDVQRCSVAFNLTQSVIVLLQQFPIIQAYACTIHKAQGLSLRTVMVDAGSTIFQAGMTYVALSRVKTLDGLHLINFDPSCATANPACITEINRLRTQFGKKIPLEDAPQNNLPKAKDRPWYKKLNKSDMQWDPVEPLEGFEEDAAAPVQSQQQPEGGQPEPTKKRSSKRTTGPGTDGAAVPLLARRFGAPKRKPTAAQGLDSEQPQPRAEADAPHEHDAPEPRAAPKPPAKRNVHFSDPPQQESTKPKKAPVRAIRPVLPPPPPPPPPVYPQFANAPPTVSCYANTSAHFLFSCSTFCDMLRQEAISAQLPSLRRLLDSYTAQVQTGVFNHVETMDEVRAELENTQRMQWTLPNQQDAPEFIEAILTRLGLQAVLELRVWRSRCSVPCAEDRRPTEGEEDIHYNVWLGVQASSQSTMEEQIDGFFRNGEAIRCPLCLAGRVDLAPIFDPPEYLAVKIIRYNDAGFNNTPIGGTDDEFLQIRGVRYEIIAVIFHHSRKTDYGHYTCCIKKGNEWIECDDRIVRRTRFPAGLRYGYMALLRKMRDDEGGAEATAESVGGAGATESTKRRLDETPGKYDQGKKAFHASTTPEEPVRPAPPAPTPGPTRRNLAATGFGESPTTLEQEPRRKTVPGPRIMWPVFTSKCALHSAASAGMHFVMACEAFRTEAAASTAAETMPQFLSLLEKYRSATYAKNYPTFDMNDTIEAVREHHGFMTPYDFVECILTRLDISESFKIRALSQCDNDECPLSAAEAITITDDYSIFLSPDLDLPMVVMAMVWKKPRCLTCPKCKGHTYHTRRLFDRPHLLLRIERTDFTGGPFRTGLIPGVDGGDIRIGDKIFTIVAMVKTIRHVVQFEARFAALLKTKSGWLEIEGDKVSPTEFPRGFADIELVLLQETNLYEEIEYDRKQYEPPL